LLDLLGDCFRVCTGAKICQAKCKIERQHQCWQGRLPALFAAENITAPEDANALLPQLRHHRNARENRTV